MIVIVGAGLSGLICAKELLRRKIDGFLLLEKESEPGGRVRSEVTPEGFVLDRGFQVLLDSYPAVKRHLDLGALEPRYFESGAVIADNGKRWTAAHPLRQPYDLLESALGEYLPVRDKARLIALVAEVLVTPDAVLGAATRSGADVSTAQFLWRRGFSPLALERFFRPFFGGVFLDNQLGTSAALFRYYLKKFATGQALLPARGIGQIPRQLAASIPAFKLRFSCGVERISLSGDRADAVVTSDGEVIPLDLLVLCTDEPATGRLLERPANRRTPLATTVVYYETPAPINDRAMLVLPAGRKRLVRHFAPLSNVAPEYAPPDRHLLAATVLDRIGLDDLALSQAARRELTDIYPAMAVAVPITVVTVPYAQRRQPPGFAASLSPAPAPTHLSNVFLAGDQTTACSIQSSMVSGERAAASLARLVS